MSHLFMGVEHFDFIQTNVFILVNSYALNQSSCYEIIEQSF